MRAAIRRFLQGESGATAVEYAVVLALLMAAAASSVGVVGSRAGGYWGGIRDQIVSFGVGD